MQIYGFLKTTLLDYPGHVAAAIFTGGCNFSCPYCHNSEIAFHPSSKAPFLEDEVISHLKKRRGILDGVCLTGGEPTLQPDLVSFLKQLKELGYPVKLDTNGYQPEVLWNLAEQGLVDYVAMDIKHAPEKYNDICRMKNFDFSRISSSVSFLKAGSIPCEFRTTVVKELHCQEDFLSIATFLEGADSYYLQPFTDNAQVPYAGLSSYTKKELENIQSLLIPKIKHVFLRGIA